MKIRIFFLLFFFIATHSYGEEYNNRLLFEKSEKAIVQIALAVKINAEKVKNKILFNKLGKELPTTLLDNYYYTNLGSGFFINKDGFIPRLRPDRK